MNEEEARTLPREYLPKGGHDMLHKNRITSKPKGAGKLKNAYTYHGKQPNPQNSHRHTTLVIAGTDAGRSFFFILPNDQFQISRMGPLDLYVDFHNDSPILYGPERSLL